MSEELILDDRAAVEMHYDLETDAATIYLHPQHVTNGKPSIAHTQPCKLLEFDGRISPLHLHFDADDRLVSIEVSDASRTLPEELLTATEPQPVIR